MKKELAVVVSNDNDCSILETINAIEKANFQNVFVQWYDNDYEIDQLKQVQICRNKGFNILFAHLGYQNINEIWLSEGDYFIDRYKKDILDCHNLGIDMVVMHPCSKFEAPGPNDIGLYRFKSIIEYAKSLNVKVAIENTKIREHISYIFDNIHEDNLGLCFDVGHFHCNFKDNWDITRYKDKVFCVHLHDNNGTQDQHLLPFDGNINWQEIISILNEINYNGPITMELCYRNDYLNMNVDDFYKQSYQRGQKIIDII